jgi:hypothetical protein
VILQKVTYSVPCGHLGASQIVEPLSCGNLMLFLSKQATKMQISCGIDEAVAKHIINKCSNMLKQMLEVLSVTLRIMSKPSTDFRITHVKCIALTFV